MTVSKVESGSNLKSIGLPLKHVSAMILHPDSLEPTEPGEIGELCLSGLQLAEGYLKRPDLTARSFLNTPSGRIYRTGDLARWPKGHEIECFGRKDNQVKINGYRIELGEIEHAISKTSGVHSCVVAVAELERKRQLVSFCVFSNYEGEPNSSHELLLSPYPSWKLNVLHDSLTTLPHYMLPSIWLPLRSFPLLASGKTNRRLLVELAESLTRPSLATYMVLEEDGNTDFKPVRTTLEKMLQMCWSEVLDIPSESVGASSSFIALGGDSIAAINLVSACRREHLAITVNQILSNTILEQQVKVLKSTTNGVVEDIHYKFDKNFYARLEAASVLRSDIEDIYPCSPGQVEFLIQGHTQKQFWQLTTDRPLPSGFDFDKWLMTTRELTKKNQILRAMYLKSNESDPLSWVQVILKEPVMDFSVAVYKTESEKQNLVAKIRDGFFELGKPYIKYQLLVSAADGSRSLCIKVDHGSYDGTLLRIFDDQFTAMAQGLPIPKPTEFKTFVDWNQRANRTQTLDFWTKLLQGREPCRPLGVRPQASGTLFSVVDDRVNAVASQAGVTASIVFQAAYTLLLGHLESSQDVLYDNLLTGRNADVDNPQLINGTCANFLPYRSRFDDHTTVEELLKETQSLFWNTTEHGTVGLGDIYKAADMERDVYSAKMLFCYQPFDPPPAEQEHMRWVVMALSKVMMTVNYAIMFEVSKTKKGYKLKMQFDGNVMGKETAERVLDEYKIILETMVARRKEAVQVIWERNSMVKGILL